MRQRVAGEVWTQQRCQVARSTFVTVAFRPSGASETGFTPARPRRFRVLRKSSPKGSASELPSALPRTSRRPSALTQTAMVPATETIRPTSRTFT